MERKNIPVYKLIIDDENESGVAFVALVDEPAIEHNWLAFARQQQFKVTSEDQHIVSGPLMVPDVPIYRRDAQMGEHYVLFDKDIIRKIVLKFFRNGFTAKVNLMHHTDVPAEGVYLFESFLTDSRRGISPPRGFEDLPEGSWFASYKVDNDAIWNGFVRTGKFNGFSVEGLFTYAGPLSEEERLLERIISVLKEVRE